MNTFAIIISVTLISCLSFTGAFLLSINKSFLKKALLYFVSFATGAIFANVFLHLLPEAVESSNDVHQVFGLVLAGIIASFILEKFIHWHHCHNLDCHHKEPVGMLVLVGDALHNIIDGILITSAYLVDIHLGIATTIAIALHEIPQELSDFSILIHSGYSRVQALLVNFGSALTAFIGVGIVFALRSYIHSIELVLIALAAGNFLYIAGSDLIPSLHKQNDTKKALGQLLAMLAGIAVIYTIVLMGGEHAHEEEDTTVIRSIEQQVNDGQI